ncbi:MAG: hypothetical protein KJ645_10505 [Planctomycetes bacterium]|nr:hypothetical protein [Planctomycetota bacterium]
MASYEALRRKGLADRSPIYEAKGMFLFQSQGMVAWMEMAAQKSPPDKASRPSAETRPVFSTALCDEAKHVLAEMVFSAVKEEYAHAQST